MNMKKISTLIVASAAFAFAQQSAPVQSAAAPAPAPASAEQTDVAASTAPANENANVAASENADASAKQPTAPANENAGVAANEKNDVIATLEGGKQSSASANEKTDAAAEQPVRKGPPKTPFTVLHGSAYNTVQNEAAADNIDILLNKRLTKLYGQKFFYIEPASERGAFSMGNFFAAMDVSGDLGRATAGYTNGDFAIEGRLSLGQFAVDGDNGKKSGSYAGDDWGITASKMIKGFSLTATVDWVTDQNQENVEPLVGKNTEERYRELKGSLILASAATSQKHFWSAGIGFSRNENVRKVGGKNDNDDPDESFGIIPVFNYGTPILRRDRANLFLGLNTSVPVIMHEDQTVYDDAGDSADTKMFNASVELIPNILGEVLLNNSLMVFGEASYCWHAFDYTSGKVVSGDEFTDMKSVSNVVSATAGIRYQYEDLLALEFAFGDEFFTGTKAIFNGEGVFVKFGGFIYF